jgi:hypothetical protein
MLLAQKLVLWQGIGRKGLLPFLALNDWRTAPIKLIWFFSSYLV